MNGSNIIELRNHLEEQNWSQEEIEDRINREMAAESQRSQYQLSVVDTVKLQPNNVAQIPISLIDSDDRASISVEADEPVKFTSGEKVHFVLPAKLWPLQMCWVLPDTIARQMLDEAGAEYLIPDGGRHHVNDLDQDIDPANPEEFINAGEALNMDTGEIVQIEKLLNRLNESHPLQSVSIEVEDKEAVMERVCEMIDEQYDEADVFDGPQVNFDNGWFRIYASESDPLIHIIVGAQSQNQVDTIIEEAQSVVRGVF